MKHTFALVIVLAVLVVACGDDDDGGTSASVSASVPGRPAERQGVITSISGSTILVEEFPDQESGDKISAAVATETVIVRDGEAAAFDDLEVGQQVQVWVDGPIAESYPEQGGASAILIVT